jgi:copper chaperone
MMSDVTTLFQVPGMTCGYCKRSIEGALRPVAGVSAATVDLKAKTVHVTYDSGTVTHGQLAENIETCGYDVAGATEVSPA